MNQPPAPQSTDSSGSPVAPLQQPQLVASQSLGSPVELEVYKILATLFNSEETSFWTRNNILVAIQGALIAATVAILAGSEKVLMPGAPRVATILLFIALAALSLVGLCMAIAWIFMVGRSERIADTISMQLKEIEEVFAARQPKLMATEFQAFRTFGKKLDPKAEPTEPPQKTWSNNTRLPTLWRRIGVGLSMFWTICLLSFAFLGFALRPAPASTDSKVIELLEHMGKASDLSATAAVKAATAAEAAALSARVAANNAVAVARTDRTSAASNAEKRKRQFTPQKKSAP